MKEQRDPFSPEEDRIVMVYFAPSARLKSAPDGYGDNSIGGMAGVRLERMGLRLALGDYDALPNNNAEPAK